MSYLDRVRVCQQWRPEAYRPFFIGNLRVGRVRHGLARRLADFPRTFAVSDDAVRLVPALNDFESRSEAVGGVAKRLIEAGDLKVWRKEDYPVVRRWGEPPFMRLNRGVVPDFGVRGYGIHVNGLVEEAGRLSMWVGTRAKDKKTAPGKFDHLVAGGQPFGLGLQENLVKEAWEEAAVPRELAAAARPAGLISYICERPEGLRDDVCFCYDLYLPADFEPRNTDGEVESFALWPIADVMRRVSESDDFKFNVNLVIIDFLVRRGLIDPEEPGYEEIAEGLRLGPASP